MDIDKWIKVAADYLAQYAHDFVQTLREPWPLAERQPVPIVTQAGEVITVDAAPSTSEVLSARVWVFCLLSILIGFTLNKIAHQVKGADIQQVIVYIAVSWVAFGIYAFVLSKLVLKGTADLLSSLRATLYVLGVTYVIASFAAMLGSFGAPVYSRREVFHWIPTATYLVTQGALIAFLLGRNFRALNGFRGWRTWCFALLAPVPILAINLLAGAVIWSEAWMTDLLKK